MTQIRPFIPARDFEQSKAFYQAIGFTLGYHDSGVAIFESDEAGLLLQNYYVEDWAANSMHQLIVADLDDWWTRTNGLDERFGVRAPKAPEMQAWGIRVGFLVDPAGVLWHVCEAGAD